MEYTVQGGFNSALLQVDLKVPVLQNHIKACPNLSRFVSKAIQRFFPSGTVSSTNDM